MTRPGRLPSWSTIRILASLPSIFLPTRCSVIPKVHAPFPSPSPRRRIGILEDLPLARHHLVSLLKSLAPWLEVAWAVDN